MGDFNVLIAGAGPAGCTTAISLAAFAPELTIGLVATGTGEVRIAIGETVPPQINPLLTHLGVWQEFSGAGHSPSYRTTAAWGDARLGGNEFLLHAHQVGWRLDRAAFDRMLVNAASRRVPAFFGGKVTALSRKGGKWCVSLSDDTVHTADFIVDTTGRAAALARRCGLRPASIDRLVACWWRTGSRSDGTEGLLIESCAEGWWYTAALPGGERVLACMTDADRVRPLELLSPEGFVRLLAATEHMRRVAVLEDTPAQPPAILPAASRFFDIPSDLPLLCVGDAGLRFDPLAGQGIVKALHSGIFASYAIADWLRRGDARGLARYRLMLRREFAGYCRALHEYYGRERRWADSPFWRRRHDRALAIDAPPSD